MERRGLLAGSPDPMDGRGRLIGLTEDGEAVYAQVIGRRRSMIEDALGGIEADQALVDALDIVVERLSGLR